MIRKLRVALFVSATAAMVSGCALFPSEPQETTVNVVAAASETAPVDAPVAFVETRLRRGNGVVFNRLGGEVPRGAPVEPVEERPLGEVDPATAG
ncbi:MAG: hypothetical protein AAFY10_14280 [Pseudomonadota bacterium]